MRKRRSSTGQSGQAVVESAIVLPLYVFLVLGTLQLSLMHQARLMTKYAAYKAVRAGALHNARIDKMEDAALAVLLPMISEPAGSGAESISPVNGAAAYSQKWSRLRGTGNLQSDTGFKYAAVTICGPLTGDVSATTGNEVDFDDPKVASGGDWAQSERTKLRAQVTFNYRMAIPFANMVIHMISRNRELPFILRMQNKGASAENIAVNNDRYNQVATGQKIYVLPIRATYTMRMQSNIYIDKAPLPSDNECIFTFSY